MLRGPRGGVLRDPIALALRAEVPLGQPPAQAWWRLAGAHRQRPEVGGHGTEREGGRHARGLGEWGAVRRSSNSLGGRPGSRNDQIVEGAVDFDWVALEAESGGQATASLTTSRGRSLSNSPGSLVRRTSGATGSGRELTLRNGVPVAGDAETPTHRHDRFTQNQGRPRAMGPRVEPRASSTSAKSKPGLRGGLPSSRPHRTRRAARRELLHRHVGGRNEHDTQETPQSHRHFVAFTNRPSSTHGGALVNGPSTRPSPSTTSSSFGPSTSSASPLPSRSHSRHHVHEATSARSTWRRS